MPYLNLWLGEGNFLCHIQMWQGEGGSAYAIFKSVVGGGGLSMPYSNVVRGRGEYLCHI